MRLEISCTKKGEANVRLFEGEVYQRTDRYGGRSRYIEELITPLAFRLSVEARYSPECDKGVLSIYSDETPLVEASPLCLGFGMVLRLPSEEELTVLALPDA